jgi:phosphatidylglycerol---prolipoprotein diacylglyceryl transferase
VLRWFTHRRGSLQTPGRTGGIFLLGYGLCRIAAEFTKEWDHLHALTTEYTSPGMIYSLPMVIFGLYLIRGAGWRRSGPVAEKQTPAHR